MVLSRVYIVFLNLAETLNDVTRPDEGGGAIDSLMAGVGDAVLDTDDIDYETEHDSRKRQIAMQVIKTDTVLRNFSSSGSCPHDRAEGVRAGPGERDGPAAGRDELQGDHHERGRGDSGQPAGVRGALAADWELQDATDFDYV